MASLDITQGNMDKKFNSLQELLEHQANIRKNPVLADLEQQWVNTYVKPLMYLMGDPHIMFYQTVHVVKSSEINNVKDIPRVYFASRGHWYARPPGSNVTIDPFVDVQIQGTNQFCQTYAAMLALNILKPARSKTFTKYYEYTVQALKRIKYIIQTLTPGMGYPFNWINEEIRKEEAVFHRVFNLGLSDDIGTAQKQMLRIVDECLKHPNACLNMATALSSV